VTRTPLSRSKGQRSRSPGRFAHRRVGASGSCNFERGNVLAVGNCCYVVVCSPARGASALTGAGEGRGAGACREGCPPTACYMCVFLCVIVFFYLMHYWYCITSTALTEPCMSCSLTVHHMILWYIL